MKFFVVMVTKQCMPIYLIGIKINTFPFNYMKNSRNSENTWVFVEPTVKKIIKMF